jgi:hypothetical protein
LFLKRYSDAHGYYQLRALFDFSKPVTGLAALFASVPPLAGLKKCAAYFFKEARNSGAPVSSPPAAEAKVAI